MSKFPWIPFGYLNNFTNGELGRFAAGTIMGGAGMILGAAIGVNFGKIIPGVQWGFNAGAWIGGKMYDLFDTSPEEDIPSDPLPHCNPRLNLWNDAESAQETPPVHYDPLVLDLNRDGKINLDNATFFDLNASGFHEYTRWISETDAFLVLDINGNGKIDNGSEMFGDSMRLLDGSIALSGFDALRSYDSNGDGKIDANDEIFSSLKLLTGAGQLVTLGDAGVKSINIPDRTRLPEFNASALPRDERIRQDYQRWLDGKITATKGSFSLAA